jgi:hypothetical protein
MEMRRSVTGAIVAATVFAATVMASAPAFAQYYYDAGPGYAPGYGYDGSRPYPQEQQEQGQGGYGYGGGYIEQAPPAGPIYEGRSVGQDPAMGAGDQVAWCEGHYKSYNPETGTYLGFDGMRHPCP